MYDKKPTWDGGKDREEGNNNKKFIPSSVGTVRRRIGPVKTYNIFLYFATSSRLCRLQIVHFTVGGKPLETWNWNRYYDDYGYGLQKQGLQKCHKIARERLIWKKKIKIRGV